MSARPAEKGRSRKAPQRQPLKVVRRNKQGLIKRAASRRMAPLIAIGAIFVAGTILTVLLSQVVLAQSGFKMAQLRADIAEAEEEQAALLLKAAQMNSSERIERYAVEHLGMVYPQRWEYVVADVRTRSITRLADESPEPALGAGQAAAGLSEDAP